VAFLFDKKLHNYAINKYKKGIVYQSQDGSCYEISLEDYLKENPEGTETDFKALKELSDQIYYEQVYEESRYERRAYSLELFTESEALANPSLYMQYVEAEDIKCVQKATLELLERGGLTEVQKRRFILHFIEGLSYRKIAELEQVHFTSVQESIEACTRKYFRIITDLSEIICSSNALWWGGLR
jgi:DNA-directed RNA polymerase specialized sigma24 family protein